MGRKIIIVIPIPFSIWLNYIGDSRSDEIWKWKKNQIEKDRELQWQQWKQ